MNSVFSSQGWHDEKFLLGNRLYGPAADERVNLTPEAARVGGEIKTFHGFETWAAVSDGLFAPGQEARGFVLLAGFAAPLLALLEDGGCTIVLISDDKPQQQMLYAGLHSIYGKQQCLHIPRAIGYDRKFEILHACGNLPCVHPELLSADPVVSERFMEDAILQNTVLVAGSKVPVDKKLADRFKPPNSYEKRVLELYLPVSDPQQDAELTSAYHNNFGTTGARFIRYVAANRGYFRTKLKEYRVSVGRSLGDRDSERLLLNLVACVGMAAEICRKLDILHVSSERMVEYAKTVLEGQRARDYQAVHEPELTLRDYLMARLDSVLVVMGGAKSHARETVILDTEGETVVRYEIAVRNLLVAVPDFVRWCQSRHQNGRRILKELQASGVMPYGTTLNGLRAGHPLPRNRPNPRVTTMEVNPDHALVAAHVLEFEKALRIERRPAGPVVPGYSPPEPPPKPRKAKGKQLAWLRSRGEQDVP